MPERVAVIGEGSWGTALSVLLAAAGNGVNIYCHHPDAVAAINHKRQNPFRFPDIPLDDAIHATADVAIPSVARRIRHPTAVLP